MRIASRVTVSVAAIASLVFALAFFSPVESVDSDPAIALLASQALIDHQTLSLDPYRFPDRSAYSLYGDYRIRRISGGTYYYSIGVPILSAPAVWIANRFGYHMLDQRAEFATQNLLSALSCALLFVLLFRVCRSFAGPVPSLTIATASTLGTSIMSTGASGLWTTDYALIFVALALLRLARRELGASSRWDVAWVTMLVAAGFLCRPATGLFGVACVVYFLGDRDRALARGAAVTLVAVALVVGASWVWPPSLLHHYYSPDRLWPVNPLGQGVQDLLLSPSRGLFVFSPFLVLVTAGALWQLPRLRGNRMFWLSVTWIVLHIVFSAVKKGRWWGGHSFGPRVLVDIIPGFVILTCLLWREMAQTEAPRIRRVGVAGYVALGAVAVAIHSGQGLLNPSTRLWNSPPDVDRFPEYARSWRYPQFLASPGMLAARLDEHDRRDLADRIGRLGPYEMGRVIPFDSTEAVFIDWYDAEDGFRWNRGTTSSVLIKPAQVDSHRLHLLEIDAIPKGTQHVAVSVNHTPLDDFELNGAASRLVAVPGRLLRAGEEITITLKMSNPSAAATDARQVALALRHLRLSALPDGFEVRYGEDQYFGDGFSVAEDGWRWTDGPRAALLYPFGAVEPDRHYDFELRAIAYGRQRVELIVNGRAFGPFVFPGIEAHTSRFRLPGDLLLADRVNRVELQLPDAAKAPPPDPRRLGLGVISVRIAPAPGGNGAGAR